jgi:hypothetical protein
VETIPYSQFKQYIAEGTLRKLTIGPENIRGTLKGKGRPNLGPALGDVFNVSSYIDYLCLCT